MLSPAESPTKVHARSTIELVGNTPLVRLESLTKGLRSDVYVKLESANPGGSVKDRTALSMVREAERTGALKPGATIVESSSGNTGIGLALIGALTGHPVIVVAGDTTSQEKLALLRGFNAEVVLTDWTAPVESPDNARNVAARLAADIPDSWRPQQFDNPANPRAHYASTGPEIWRQTSGAVTHLVASIGTGGTISGTGRFLKDRSRGSVNVIGADPAGSVYSGGEPGEILVDGVGNTWGRPDWPAAFDPEVVDHFVRISNDGVYSTVHRLAEEEGLILGPSSGLAVAAALEAARSAPAGSTIVAIAPDAGTNYLSKAFNRPWLEQNGITL
nr:cysteine synthase family protein [Arthrobacter sp. H-02-3]